ncbi:MAG TPA: glycine betaine ABC transporter substrate-binding protein [Candidatus Acidoferrales bacterium]|nr:glycine betaine ABC transporter substrate-binding protein [Candidatus Acidoferrales bacterium]
MLIRQPWLACVAVVLAVVGSATRAHGMPITVGAKNFTEAAVLGEVIAQVLERQLGATVERRFNLAGTQVAFDALRNGGIDIYVEYTGTGLREILGDPSDTRSPADVFARVSKAFTERYDLAWLAPFGFNNTYVLLMRSESAAQRQIKTISDLARQSARYGMSHEFLERRDGMPALREAYGLQVASLVGMEHDLAYEALAEDAIDVADGYSTDAKIATRHLAVLQDDRSFFPPYEAAPLVRQALLRSNPAVQGALALLAGRIDDETMREMNRQVEGDRRVPADVAAAFLAKLGIGEAKTVATARSESLAGTLWQRREITLRLAAWHLVLTVSACLLACCIAVPLGIAVSRRPRSATAALAVAGILQTIPSIALLAFMLPLFGIGARPAIAALFLYGLLPILRNTVTGLRGIDGRLIEVGLGLGMTRSQLLRQVELPLSAPFILAGIRTATVINVGTATLAAFIGAGGLGEPIVTGLTVTDTNLVLSGALPAALLAVLVDGLLGRVEHWATPRGLRLQSAEG